MKFTLSWLKTHLETTASLSEITDALTMIGLELEGVENRGAALAPFRVAHVIEAVQHPNADRLRACTVDTGAGLVSVVCGAPNARTGMKAVFAPPGSFIPGTGITLKVGEIRGVQSAGMLLSVREMGLGEEHDGILELSPEAPVGVPYAAWAGLDDPVIDIAVTPNRGDALSVRGVARDLAAAGLGTLLPFAPAPVPAEFESPFGWAIAMQDACPWVLGRTITGLKNGPSPQWLQDRLLAIGLRPINALVDVTNFFTIDLGRPLHVFDAGKISGTTLTFRPGDGETFKALNGKDYTATPDDCVIADAAGVQSLAGVIGGEATGCDAATTSVFVECALFNPVRVALTGRRHQVASDARSRFERGIDPALLPDAIEAATRMIQHLCGGQASTVAAAGAEPHWRRTASLRFERLAGLGGLDVAPDEVVGALERLGFTVAGRDAERVVVQVPSWRNDIAAGTPLEPSATLPAERAAKAAAGRAEIEPECDLIEEVLRLGGLDRIPPVSLPAGGAVPAATLTPRQARASVARRTLAAQGLAECVTFSFMEGARAALFGGTSEALRLANPIAADLDQMRPTPLATLALAAARNAARGHAEVGLFEIGPAYPAIDRQVQVAAGLRAGPPARHWAAPATPATAMDAKADVWTVLAALGVPMDARTVTADAPAHCHPGRSGCVRQGPKTVLATFGELHPERVGHLLIIGAADRANPMATAWRSVQRQILRFAVDCGRPKEGVKLARALAMSTYRSTEEFAARFNGEPALDGERFVFPVESYLFARGSDYASRYRPEAFLCLSE
ncbi:MAG: phenylalanine--tRNA ligase subunit beta, partial [Rhodospirillales bacterium]|nr:phenylalanine--tRNA ligase subunit beta [Rhodospirillales bacterium]